MVVAPRVGSAARDFDHADAVRLDFLDDFGRRARRGGRAVGVEIALGDILVIDAQQAAAAVVRIGRVAARRQAEIIHAIVMIARACGEIGVAAVIGISGRRCVDRVAESVEDRHDIAGGNHDGIALPFRHRRKADLGRIDSDGDVSGDGLSALPGASDAQADRGAGGDARRDEARIEAAGILDRDGGPAGLRNLNIADRIAAGHCRQREDCARARLAVGGGDRRFGRAVIIAARGEETRHRDAAHHREAANERAPPRIAPLDQRFERRIVRSVGVDIAVAIEVRQLLAHVASPRLCQRRLWQSDVAARRRFGDSIVSIV